MARKIFLALGFAAGVAAVVAGWNWASVHRHMAAVVDGDPRNEGMQVRAHYGSYVNPQVIVYDLRDVSGDMTPMDVTRALLQFAQAMKGRSFEKVVLAHRGDPRFMLRGDYFQQLGEEYDIQNPVYTLRTMPQNVLELDGSPAFETWTGGLLGVVGGQLEDFNTLHARWYIEDMAGRAAAERAP